MTPRGEAPTILLASLGATVIGGVTIGLASYDPSVDQLRFAAGAGVTWLYLTAALGRLRDSEPREPLSVATWVTLARGLLIALVAGFALGRVPAGRALWAPGGLYAVAAIADRLDGALARRLGCHTALGAKLDVSADAVGLLVAPLVGVRWGRLSPWSLALALAYPAFRLALAARRALRLPTFPDRLVRDPRARFFAGLQMVVVAASLFPVLPRAFTWPVATLAMLPTLALFAGEWRLVTRPSATDGDAGAQRLDA